MNSKDLKNKSFDLSFTYDDEAQVWVACCDELGIALEDKSYIGLIERVAKVLPEMTKLNKPEYLVNDLEKYKCNTKQGSMNHHMLSCDEQLKRLSQILESEIKEFDALSEEEKEKRALEDLKEIGYLDKDGNIAEPYIELMKKPPIRRCVI